MPLFGTISVWTALAALVLSLGLYLAGRAKAGRVAFIVAALGVLGASGALGTLLVTHRFDVQYVYDHSARAMSPLYYFPSFWAGQEGSFLLWAFWIAILGVVLACTSGPAERRVMPIYGTRAAVPGVHAGPAVSVPAHGRLGRAGRLAVRGPGAKPRTWKTPGW